MDGQGSPLFFTFLIEGFALSEERPSEPGSTGVTVPDWPLCQREMGIRHSLTSRLSGHRSRCKQILQVFLVHRGITAEEQGLVGLWGKFTGLFELVPTVINGNHLTFPVYPQMHIKNFVKAFLKSII